MCGRPLNHVFGCPLSDRPQRLKITSKACFTFFYSHPTWPLGGARRGKGSLDKGRCTTYLCLGARALACAHTGFSANNGLPRRKEHTAPKQDKSCNSDWVCQTPTVPKGTALSIVSQSPGPGGDSDRHLPPGRGKTKPDKQTNPAPPVGGWVGRQTLSGNSTTPARGTNLDRGAACRHAQSPEPPGPAQPSSMEQHNQPQAPIMLPTQPPPPEPGQPSAVRPVGGWVGGQKTARE